MKKLFVILLVSLSYLTFSQEQNNQQIRNYTIEPGDLSQTIELIEYSNHKFTGKIITKLDKGGFKWNRGWLNRKWRHLWKIKTKEVIYTTFIEENVAKQLTIELEENGIETIKKCNEDADCASFSFLDGNSTSFMTITNNTIRESNFQCIYPFSDNYIETNEIRKQAQKLMGIINKHLNLKKQFSSLIKTLPRGEYTYFKGIVAITIKHNKRQKIKK